MIDKDFMPTAKLYDEVDNDDKERIVNNFIQYIVIYNKNMDDIRKEVTKIVWNELVRRRNEAITIDNILKIDVLNSYSASLSKKEVFDLLKECSTFFRVKQRVNMLMTKEQESIEKLI